MKILGKYFPSLKHSQLECFRQLAEVFPKVNERINLVSRKDIDAFVERHVVHSLSIAHFVGLDEKRSVMDLGTGGGLPGIPLAIYYPDIQFHLVDSIRKKVAAVEEITEALALDNVSTSWSRAEDIKGNYDVVVSRAVAKLDKLLHWTEGKTRHLIVLKGGELSEEIASVEHRADIETFQLADHFTEPFFETKKILSLRW